MAPKMVPTPQGPMADMGTVIVDVNLKTRTVTTHPMVSGSLAAPSGVSAAMYGASELISHNFTLDGGAPSAGNTYILSDRIENKLSWPIGTHIAHAPGVFPSDTMGVFVFLSVKPTVLSGCSANPDTCTVTADSGEDGAYPFSTADPQPYMYFKTILEAADVTPHSGLDYSGPSAEHPVDYSRSLAFRASPAVTDFRFGVSVSAAFVRPHETQWIVRYIPDALPNRVGTSLDSLRSSPDWRVGALDTVDSKITGPFCAGPTADICLGLQNKTPSMIPGAIPDSIIYSRGDSIGANDSASIEAQLSTRNLKVNNPSVFMGMQDGVKTISFGIAANKWGFVNSSNLFIAGGVDSVPLAPLDWKIVKYAQDSVQIYGDGALLLTMSYNALSPAPPPTLKPEYFWFGQRVKGAPNNPVNVASLWNFVTYSIGLP